MKKITLIIGLFLTQFAFSQFTISGEIENYKKQPVFVKIFKGASDRIINRVVTDQNGKFSVNIPMAYHGIIRLETPEKSSLTLLSDNENTHLKSSYSGGKFNNTFITEGKSAQAFMEFKKYENLNDLKLNAFPVIKAAYDQQDDFYKAIEKEENRIAQMNAAVEIPLLKYYQRISDLVNTQVDTKPAAEVHQNKILDRLVNDNDNLEGTGLLPDLVVKYLQYSLFGVKDQNEAKAIVDAEVQNLLDKTDIETPRGQNVLTSVFQVLPQNQFGTVLDKYYKMANDLTCEITEDLRSDLSAHNMAVGAVVPNIIFNQPVKGYKSLHEINADKKIIIFWASWCPACRDEMPFIKEYYENFKKEGGEIVGISLDIDEKAYTEFIKDYPWINYSELVRWDGQGVKEFGVQATPTLYLVDKDNKLIKTASHISELVEL
ncbi:MAG: TlpA disulfide reductase family protein [Weeksellaceae bacterium]